ncbi:ABC transporter family substrate-binding protein [Arthrobacter sp. JSM 101049]|uniref:ABC transporter family substrate-binding protein n=1 Tax=Arthrobacter sp. JSM 101049 TaxID=929097 RepID=UPI0035689573
MKINKYLAVAVTASALALTGCGGPSGGGTEGGESSTATQPPQGVAPDTSPMPMPEVGQLYNNPQKRENVKDGGTLTLPIGEIPPNFNGFNIDGNSVYTRYIDEWSSPNLWNFTEGGEASPDKDYLLSAELVSEDPETIKYVLNPDAKWNNGDPITWKSFETTWKTQSGASDKYNPSSTDGYENIESVKMGENEKEAIVTFKTLFYPYQTLFSNLEHPKNLDPEFYKTGWVNDPHNELRAGPYKISGHSKTQLTLVPNPDWWGEKPKLDKIVYKQMESTASINAFQNGEIDATAVGTADRLAQIKDMEDVQVRRGFDNSVGVYTFGQDSDLFKNDYARKAFALSTDREQLQKIEFEGMDWKEPLPGSEVLYPWMPTYKDNLEGFSYDVEAAKKLMEDNGWTMGEDGYYTKDGKVAEFNYVNFGDNPISAARARAQQAMSKEAGLKLNIENKKSADFSKTITSGAFDVVIMAWSQSDPYGYAWACQLYCSDSESNFSGVGSEEVDKMMKKVTTVADPKEAIKLANEAEAKALGLFGTLPLSNGPEMTAVKAGLANYGPSGWLVEEPENIGWVK